MANSRVFRHEDNSAGAKVFYNLSLCNMETSKPTLKFEVEKMMNEIYHDSKREKVLVPPNVLSINFEHRETLKLMGLFVEAVSIYMAAVRKKLYFSNTLRMEFEPINSKYKILFHAVNKKISGQGKEKNSARLIMSFFDKESGEEIISVKLKKTKLIMLLQIIKSLYDENISKVSLGYEDMKGRRISLVRVGDTVAVGNIWIHGREIQKFQDYIERVIFDFKFKVGSGKEMFSYRQISAKFSFDENIAQIDLVKYTKEHRVYLDDDGENSKLSFIVNSEFTAFFYLLLPKAIEFNIEDEEVKEEDESYENIVENDRKRLSSIDDGDFILNMIEAQMVLKVNKKKSFNAKTREGKMSLAIRYRDFIVEDEEYKVGRVNKETGEYEDVRKLASCEIDLKIDWLYIFALCAEAVHSSNELELNEFGNHMHSWRFKKLGFVGGEHYGIRVIADPKNKAPVVLAIDYHLDDDGEIGDGPLPSVGGSRMRIPLFKEHIRTLLKGLIGLSSQYDNYYWMKNFPAYSDEEDDAHKEMTLGIRRSIHKGTNKEVVSFGIVGKSTEQIYLTDNDRDTLFFSAYYRLMYGRWLQFAGEQIAISADGWITDRYNEYKIELDIENSSGAKGSLAALAMLFATARSKKNHVVEDEENTAPNTEDSRGYDKELEDLLSE